MCKNLSLRFHSWQERTGAGLMLKFFALTAVTLNSNSAYFIFNLLQRKRTMKATRSAIRRHVSRRSVLGLLGFGAATAALPPTFLKMAQAQNQTQTQTQPSQPASTQPSQIITKEIPRTKEKLPAIGLGTFMTFDALSNQPRDHLQQVMRRFWDAGGRVVDTSLLYGMSEVNVGEFARTLDLTNDLFIADKTWATGEYLGDRSQAQRQLEQSLKRLSRDRIDVMQVHSLVNAVLANMPFEKARLFELVKGQPLPDFASEIGCENWAQFFLKYVISHPALTCAIPATTNPDHVVENMRALRGSLPDDSMRTRMVEHMESLPGFDNLLQTPWYPGKNFSGLVRLPNPRPIG
jgi:diketogulonate reductase-like aldo/keto reductase